MWDNRFTMHRARRHYPETAVRDMRRTTIEESNPPLEQAAQDRHINASVRAARDGARPWRRSTLDRLEKLLCPHRAGTRQHRPGVALFDDFALIHEHHARADVG